MEFKLTKKESENKTVRFPVEVIENINEAIAGKDVSFSRFVILACEFALNYMENDNKGKGKKTKKSKKK